MCAQPLWAEMPSLSKFWDHIQTGHSQQDSSGGAINPSHKPLPDYTQHSTRDWHSCPRRDLNLQSQQMSGHIPMP